MLTEINPQSWREYFQEKQRLMEMKPTKKLVAILIASIGIISCTNTSSTKNLPPPPTYSNLLTEPDVHQMSRQEVIEAIHDCQSNDMRAVIVTTKHKVGRSYTDIVIEVTCRPRFLYK